MPVKKYNPTSPGVRFKTVVRSKDITTKKNAPFPSLTKGLSKKAGRNHHGRITVRKRGGGHKRLYRMVDFLRNKKGIPARVESIEYDPNRSANIALLLYADGERRYMIAPKGLQKGQEIISADQVEIKKGNASPVGNIPVGSDIHNIELKPGKGGQLARSAGSFATISGHDKGYTLIKLPSGEVRKID